MDRFCQRKKKEKMWVGRVGEILSSSARYDKKFKNVNPRRYIYIYMRESEYALKSGSSRLSHEQKVWIYSRMDNSKNFNLSSSSVEKIFFPFSIIEDFRFRLFDLYLTIKKKAIKKKSEREKKRSKRRIFRSKKSFR